MNDRPDLERIVTAWLRADAPTRAPEAVLAVALDRVAGARQAHPLGGRRVDDWIGRSPWLRTRVVAVLAIIAFLALLGAAAAFVASQHLATPQLGAVANGWIAYSTDGPDPTDVTTGSDIYLVREGGEPKLIAGQAGGTTRNVCPVFSPDGTKLAFGVASNEGRFVIVRGLDDKGVTQERVAITVPGSGPAVCVRWSSDGTRVGYLEGQVVIREQDGSTRTISGVGGAVIVRGLDGSTPVTAAGDPSVKDLERTSDQRDPLLSPSGDWVARLGDFCQVVVAKPDGQAARIITLNPCQVGASPYAIAAWSPDGRQILLLEDAGQATILRAIGVDSPLDVTIVSAVRPNGPRSWPGRGDVSWQPVFTSQGMSTSARP